MLVLFNALQAGNRSGTGVYTQELVRWLPVLDEDIEVAIAWPRNLPAPLPRFALSEEDHLARWARRGRRWLLRESAVPGLRVFHDQVTLPMDGRRLGADVLHYPANIGSVFGGRRQIVTLHDVSFFENPAWYPAGRALYYQQAAAMSAKRAICILTGSDASAQAIRERLGISPGRIRVIPYGVGEQFVPAEEPSVRRAREKYRLPDSFFLFVGTHEPRKNISRLVEAWSRIAPDVPQDLVLAGRTGWKTGPIEESIRRSPCANRIHRPGYIEPADLPALMGAATAFCYLSLSEGFGLPVIEAMACGVPVLTSSIPALTETAGGAALLADPLDTEEIAEGLRRLSQDTDLRNTLHTKGRARVKGLAWRQTAQQTLDTYRSLLL